MAVERRRFCKTQSLDGADEDDALMKTFQENYERRLKKYRLLLAKEKDILQRLGHTRERSSTFETSLTDRTGENQAAISPSQQNEPPRLLHSSSEICLDKPRMLIDIPKGLLEKPMDEFRKALSTLDMRTLVKPASDSDVTTCGRSSPHQSPLAATPTSRPGYHRMTPSPSRSRGGSQEFSPRTSFVGSPCSPVDSPGRISPSNSLHPLKLPLNSYSSCDNLPLVDQNMNRLQSPQSPLTSWRSVEDILARRSSLNKARSSLLNSSPSTEVLPQVQLRSKRVSSPVISMQSGSRSASEEKMDQFANPALQRRRNEAKRKSLLRADALKRLEEDCNKATLLIKTYNSNDSLNMAASSESLQSLLKSSESLDTIAESGLERRSRLTQVRRTERETKSRSWNVGDTLETFV